ncbi:MAG: hypothetical protein ACOCWQ_02860 [Nanoarchaeota archaeon]
MTLPDMIRGTLSRMGRAALIWPVAGLLLAGCDDARQQQGHQKQALANDVVRSVLSMPSLEYVANYKGDPYKQDAGIAAAALVSFSAEGPYGYLRDDAHLVHGANLAAESLTAGDAAPQQAYESLVIAYSTAAYSAKQGGMDRSIRRKSWDTLQQLRKVDPGYADKLDAAYQAPAVTRHVSTEDAAHLAMQVWDARIWDAYGAARDGNKEAVQQGLSLIGQHSHRLKDDFLYFKAEELFDKQDRGRNTRHMYHYLARAFHYAHQQKDEAVMTKIGRAFQYASGHAAPKLLSREMNKLPSASRTQFGSYLRKVLTPTAARRYGL